MSLRNPVAAIIVRVGIITCLCASGAIADEPCSGLSLPAFVPVDRSEFTVDRSRVMATSEIARQRPISAVDVHRTSNIDTHSLHEPTILEISPDSPTTVRLANDAVVVRNLNHDEISVTSETDGPRVIVASTHNNILMAASTSTLARDITIRPLCRNALVEMAAADQRDDAVVDIPVPTESADLNFPQMLRTLTVTVRAPESPQMSPRFEVCSPARRHCLTVIADGEGEKTLTITEALAGWPIANLRLLGAARLVQASGALRPKTNEVCGFGHVGYQTRGNDYPIGSDQRRIERKYPTWVMWNTQQPFRMRVVDWTCSGMSADIDARTIIVEDDGTYGDDAIGTRIIDLASLSCASSTDWSFDWFDFGPPNDGFDGPNDDVEIQETVQFYRAGGIPSGPTYYFSLPVREDDSAEENDTLATAKTVLVGSSNEGLLMNDAADWFKVSTPGRGTLDVDLTYDPNDFLGDNFELGNLIVSLHNSSGTSLSSGSCSASTGLVNAATYYIKVVGNPQAYTLNVSWTPAPTCYTLNKSHSGSGSNPAADPLNSSGCSSGQYISDETINLTASPSSGYQVSGWSGTNDDGSTSNTNSVTMPPNNHTVTVYYSAIPPTCYTLTPSHSGGGGNPSFNPSSSTGCASGRYVANEYVTLTASPSPGYHVSGWSGTNDDSSTSNSNAVWMPANDHTVSVNYSVIPPTCYPLVRNHSGQGSDPSPSPAQSAGCAANYYAPGEYVSLTATPDAGWHVTHWSGTDDDFSTATTNAFTMPADSHTVSVTYEVIPATCYSLTASHFGQGSDPGASPQNSTGCSTGRYTASEVIDLTASPSPGWTVYQWAGTDNDASTSNDNTVTMPAADRAVSVTYTQPTTVCYTLTPTHTGQGGDPTPTPPNSAGCSAGQYVAGEPIDLSASPATGWSVASWAGTNNDSSTSTTNSVTMPSADRSVTVNYVGTGVTRIYNGVAVTNLADSAAEFKKFVITVPPGATNLVINISGGTGDADLYVRQGAEPTLSTWTCRPYLSGNSETCTFSSPAAAEWYIGLYTYSPYAGVTLLATYSGGTLGAMYRFDEATGTSASDSTGNGNAATIAGATHVTAFAGNGLHFAGGLDHVSLPQSVFNGFGNTAYFEARVRPNAYPTYPSSSTVFRKRADYNDWGVELDALGQVLVYLYDASHADGISVLGGTAPLNEWTKIAVWYDGVAMHLYINETDVVTYTKSITIDWPGNYFQTEIGNNTHDGSGYAFVGDIDEVFISTSPRPALSAPTGFTITRVDPIPLAPGTKGFYVQWNVVAGSEGYDLEIDGNVYRQNAPGGYWIGFEPAGWVARVRSTRTGSPASAWSNRDIAAGMPFTQDPLPAGAPITAGRLNEVRAAVNLIRTAGGLAEWSFANTVAAGSVVLAADLNDTFTAINQTRITFGMGSISLSEAIQAGTTRIRHDHLQQLRDGLK